MTRSDAITRRRLLKAGLIVAGAPFCAEALFDRRAAADDEKPAEVTPIGPREIVKGLDGMSRVAEAGNTFGLGHNAAAVISSAFFCREQRLDADTQKEIRAFLDARLLKNPIYAAGRPKEAADPKLTEGLLEDLDAGIARAARERSQHHLRGHQPQGPPRGARGGDARTGRRPAEDGSELRENKGRGPRRIPNRRSWASTTSRSSSTSSSRNS